LISTGALPQTHWGSSQQRQRFLSYSSWKEAEGKEKRKEKGKKKVDVGEKRRKGKKEGNECENKEW